MVNAFTKSDVTMAHINPNEGTFAEAKGLTLLTPDQLARLVGSLQVEGVIERHKRRMIESYRRECGANPLCDIQKVTDV